MFVKPILLVLSFLIAFTACAPKPQVSEPERHYPLTGQVVAIDAKNQTATIDAAAVPNFMEAMTMEYPIKTKADLEALHVGDKIAATVNVSASGGDYNLSNIRKQMPGK